MKKLDINEILANTSDLSQEKLVGLIAIIWRPNTWKSTFVNSLIWQKISITSHIPQTTRKKITAIYNDFDSQIIFFDTPWLHKSDKLFNTIINSQAIESLKDSDLILYFIDSTRSTWEEEKYIEELINKTNKPVLKVFTKSDLKSKIQIDDNEYKISSITQEWFKELIEKIKSYLNKWPLMFSEDYYTKQDIYFRINEIIREKVFLNTKEELPHSTYIQTEEIEEKENLLRIASYIYTESDSQKYIIIWKEWKLLTKIWKESRFDLESIFWKKVFLALRVKTNKNWKKDEKLINNII